MILVCGEDGGRGTISNTETRGRGVHTFRLGIGFKEWIDRLFVSAPSVGRHHLTSKWSGGILHLKGQ